MLYLCHDMPKPVEYCTSGKFICEKGGAVHPRRKLDTYVLLFGCEGECKIMQNGVEYILTPGTYMLLLADHEHGGTAPFSPKLSYFWCHFYLRNGCSLLNENQAKEKIAGIQNSRGGIAEDSSMSGEMHGATELILPEFGKIQSTEKYRLLFNSLIDSSLSENIFMREICNGIISQILCELSDTFLRSGERAKKPSNRALTENVIEYIRINAVSIKNVSDVAEHFGYNPEYLTTLVKKNTSHSLIDYINMGKIARAKEMLLSTNLTVSEIAPLCGFSDAKYFGRLFHRLTDTTPIEFRNTYSKIHLNKND